MDGLGILFFQPSILAITPLWPMAALYWGSATMRLAEV
jgi:hypothetical protein